MFSKYISIDSFDEYFDKRLNNASEILAPLLSSLDNMGIDQLNRNHTAAKKLLLRYGATFRLNDTGKKGVERILPFDPLPRIISNRDWLILENPKDFIFRIPNKKKWSYLINKLGINYNNDWLSTGGQA